MSGRDYTANRGAVVSEGAASVSPLRGSTAASRAVSLRPIPMDAIQVGAAVAASFALQRDSKTKEVQAPTVRLKRVA